MPQLTVIDKNGNEHVADVEEGTTLWDAIYEAGVELPHSCGFGGQCSTCAVNVLKGGIGDPETTDAALSPVDSEERDTMERFELNLETQILSCSTRITRDCTVQQPEV